MSITTKAFILSDGEVIDASSLAKYSVKAKQSAESKQLPSDLFIDLYGPDNIIQPIYDLYTLALMLEENTYHYRACKTKARDTSGLGWKLLPRNGVKSPRAGQKKLVEEFLMHNGTDINSPSENITEVFNRMMVDYEATGNGYIELIRNSVTDPIIGISHIPSYTMRRHADGTKYLQMRGARRRWFKEVGMSEDLDMNTGVVYKQNTLATEVRANECIHFYNYTSRSDYYGIPDILPAMRALLLDQQAQEYNISFFENYAIPAYAVTCVGADLDEDTKADIRRYFQKDVKDSRHSTLVIAAQRDPNNVNDQPISFKFEKLSVDVAEGSFKVMREGNRDEILSAHGVPSYRAGITDIGSMGGNVATESTRIYKQSVIDPRQNMLEDFVNKHILWDGFKAIDWQFKFNEIDIDDEKLQIDKSAELFKMGVLSPNEVRVRMGLEEIHAPGMDMHYVSGVKLSVLDEQSNPQTIATGK